MEATLFSETSLHIDITPEGENSGARGDVHCQATAQ
jgi:hypothetical protein